MDNKKKVKKKVKIKILPLLFFIVICVILYFLITFMFNLKISNIYIIGNRILSDQEIIEVAQIENYPSFIKTTSKKIEKNLKKIDYIESVEVKKKILGTIIIKIEENYPLLIDLDNNLVLSNGKVINNDRNLLAPSLINYVPDVKYKELVNKLNDIDTIIFNKISEIKYEATEQDKDRFGILMNDGNLVYITLTKFSNLNYYNDIISGITCKKGILNLDSGNHFEVKENYCK